MRSGAREIGTFLLVEGVLRAIDDGAQIGARRGPKRRPQITHVGNTREHRADRRASKAMNADRRASMATMAPSRSTAALSRRLRSARAVSPSRRPYMYTPTARPRLDGDQRSPAVVLRLVDPAFIGQRRLARALPASIRPVSRPPATAFRACPKDGANGAPG